MRAAGIFWLAWVAFAALMSGTAGAVTIGEAELWCRGGDKNNLVTPLAQIDGCTMLIESGQLSPSDLGAAYFYRGQTYDALLRYDEANRDYDQAIGFRPNLAEAYCYRGRNYYQAGLLDGAMQDLDRAISLKPDYALAYYLRGKVKSRRGDEAGGLIDIAKAKQLDPHIGD